MAKTSTNTTQQNILRFAHPFFTSTAPALRTRAFNGVTRMTDYIAQNLQPIPQYGRKSLKMTLDDIVGKKAATEISNAQQLSFHVCGDTGAPLHDMQQPIADVMTNDYDIADHVKSPSFFLHLGDVIYYDNTTEGYHQQFYEPYKKYPGKIIAIPGNHDGEMFKYNEKNQPSTGQKFSLAAFIDNFCRTKSEVPPAANTIFREMVAQPGVYWHLETDLLDIIGLYSNVSEGPGFIITANDDSQKKWLEKTLKGIAANRKIDDRYHKALIIAVHHPPFSAAGHASSTDMLNDIDACCAAAAIMPDAVLSGHSHNYQHFRRTVQCNNKKISIPYLIVGNSGHNVVTVASKSELKKPLPKNLKVNKTLFGNGYMLVKVSKQQLHFEFYEVKVDARNRVSRHHFDTSTVTLSGSHMGKLVFE